MYILHNNNRGVQTIGLVIGIIIVLVVAGGAYFLLSNSDATDTNTLANTPSTNTNIDQPAKVPVETNQNSNTNEDAVMKKEDDVMVKDAANLNSNTNEETVMEKEGEVMEKDGINTNVATEPVTAVDGQYIDYSENTYASTASQIRILYFHASWCPTCKVADADITSNLDKIPDNVVILKLDYDTETALKKKYGVTYQHTFVIVDADGNEIKKWNGGGIDLIVKNVN